MEMALEGFRLMAVGMFMVFAFLALLVGIMKASSAFFEANAHRFPEEPPDADSHDHAVQDAEIAIVLAIAEALRRGQKV